MFSMSIRPEILKNIREKYPPGTAVEVVEFNILWSYYHIYRLHCSKSFVNAWNLNT